MKYTRHYANLLGEVPLGKVLVLYGARQVGKTTLLTEALREYPGRALFRTGEEQAVRDVLQSESVAKIRSAFSGYDLVVIDEAQKVDQIGQCLKLAVDHLPEVRFIATGSSSFELAHQVGEPLTGRKLTQCLYPLSTLELQKQFGGMAVMESLEDRLVFGSYPEILLQESRDSKIQLLNELRDSYLYKDILELQNLRNAKKIGDLLRLVAYQVGKEVSLHELGTQLGMDRSTVERYLDLLEKTFVLINLRGFSRNLRKEVSKTSRYYFLDNGVLNAVLSNFNPLSLRGDTGMLWENFLFTERLKYREYAKVSANPYFWRTYDQQEIDLVEERDGRLYGYEFKYAPTRKVKRPGAWTSAYPEADFQVIHRDNWVDFVCG